MSKKTNKYEKSVEKKLLKLLFRYGGYRDVNGITKVFYGLYGEDLDGLLNQLIIKKDIIREQFIDVNGNERDAVFLTNKGLCRVEDPEARRAWFMMDAGIEKLTYERMFEGANNITDWIEKNREQLLVMAVIKDVAHKAGAVQYGGRSIDSMDDFKKKVEMLKKECKKEVERVEGAKENLVIRLLISGLEMLGEYSDISMAKEAALDFAKFADTTAGEKYVASNEDFRAFLIE